MDGRSTLLSPSPVPEPAEGQDEGVRGDGRGDVDWFFFLPLEGGIAARGGQGQGGTGRDGGEPKPWRPGQEEGMQRMWRVRFCPWAQIRPGHWTGGGKTERVRFGPRPK